MGLIDFDAGLVIYLVERHTRWGEPVSRAMAQAADSRFAISPLVICECLVGPIKRGDTAPRRGPSAVDPPPQETFMRLLIALFLALILCVPIYAETIPGPPPDNDPENVLLMKLKDGLVVIRMRPDLAPNHVKRIKELVRKGFYDGAPFHRVIPDLIAQTGDPTGTGLGGSGQSIKAEFSNEHHMRGVVSMARGDDPDSADSQWFIVLKATPDFDHRYTIWGKVIRGMEFVNHIAPGLAEADGKVLDPDRIVSLKVEADVYKAGAR